MSRPKYLMIHAHVERTVDLVCFAVTSTCGCCHPAAALVGRLCRCLLVYQYVTSCHVPSSFGFVKSSYDTVSFIFGLVSSRNLSVT